MSRVIFIDYTQIHNLNHRDIQNRAIGASEYQFYNLVGEFSKLNLDIICYNQEIINENIDNVQYKNIQYIDSDTFLQSDKIVIQRFCRFIPQKLLNNKIFVWMHDYACADVLVNSSNSIDYISKYNNIHFIFNSEFSKMVYQELLNKHGIFLDKPRYEVIYNILYEKDFQKINDITSRNSILVDKNQIVYASAWSKGIHKIIDIFRYIITVDSNIKLVLLSPGYDYANWEEYRTQLVSEFKDRIIIHKPLEKDKYCQLLKSSLCVLSPPFFETFGCVFAESYYLGTPVIADICSGAIKEIIDNEFIVDYNSPNLVLNKIKILQSTREELNISLDPKFLVKENLLLWKNFVLFD